MTDPHINDREIAKARASRAHEAAFTLVEIAAKDGDLLPILDHITEGRQDLTRELAAALVYHCASALLRIVDHDLEQLETLITESRTIQRTHLDLTD